MKKRIIRNITLTCDSHTHAHFFGRRTGDEILGADPVPKLLVAPMTWQGDLRPVLDAYLEQLKPLENGLTSGHTLGAEEIPHVLDLGRCWLGDFAARMIASARPAEAGPDPAADVSEVAAQLERLRRDMGTGNAARVADGLRRLRDAARRVSDSVGGRRSLDRHHTGDFSRPVSIAEINRRNREFHAARDATPRLDSSGRMNWRTGDAAPAARPGVRDAAHAAAQAVASADPRARLEALNRGARAFWSGSGEPITADALRRMPAPTTIGEINQRNRAFWARR